MKLLPFDTINNCWSWVGVEPTTTTTTTIIASRRLPLVTHVAVNVVFNVPKFLNIIAQDSLTWRGSLVQLLPGPLFSLFFLLSHYPHSAVSRYPNQPRRLCNCVFHFQSNVTHLKPKLWLILEFYLRSRSMPDVAAILDWSRPYQTPSNSSVASASSPLPSVSLLSLNRSLPFFWGT
jgi:hypothetical protein